MASITTKLTWITHLLRFVSPPVLFCDNNNALHMTINPNFHVRTRHIDLDFHFIREKVVVGTLVTRFISSALQVVDIFTIQSSSLYSVYQAWSQVIHWSIAAFL